MEKTLKQFKDLDEFYNFVGNWIKISEDAIELFKVEIDEGNRFEEEHVKFLHEEDEIINALNICFHKSFNNSLPAKSSFQLMNELNEADLMKSKGNSVSFHCKKHNSRTAKHICVNKSCEFTLYCMDCYSTHQKKCDRNLMPLHIGDTLNIDLLDEYFNVSDFDFDAKVRKVREWIEVHKNKVHEMLSVFEKTLINKLEMQSKEFLLKNLRNSIEDSHRKFQGKSRRQVN